jgi:hypothetical protein
MSNICIIGGGIGGLALADELSRKGLFVDGREREARLGGRVGLGHQRITSEAAVVALDTLQVGAGLKAGEWIQESPTQIKKGEFSELGEGDLENFSSEEKRDLGNTHFAMTHTFDQIVGELAERVGKRFKLRSGVESIDLQKRVLTNTSGEEFPFSKLVWTSSLKSLMKAMGTVAAAPQKKAKAHSYTESGGLTWDLACKAKIFEFRNSVVFPFRYKDLKLRAFGIAGSADPSKSEHTFHWRLFLEDELLENHEELAKIARAFKRELSKQFPSLETDLLRERLAFHSDFGAPEPQAVPSLEVAEGIVCVGRDIELASKTTDSAVPALGINRVLVNMQDFLETILPQWESELKTGESLSTHRIPPTEELAELTNG